MKKSKEVFGKLVTQMKPLKEDEKGKLRGGFQGISKAMNTDNACGNGFFCHCEVTPSSDPSGPSN